MARPKFTKRQRFVREYLVDLNGTNAAIRAGYAPASAGIQARRLLSIAKVQADLAVQMAALAAKTDVHQGEIINELRKIAFASMQNYTRLDGDKRVLDLTQCDSAQMAAIQEITEDTTGGTGDGERKQVLRTRVKLWDKSKALETLARTLGMLQDVQRHESVILVQVTDRLRSAIKREQECIDVQPTGDGITVSGSGGKVSE